MMNIRKLLTVGGDERMLYTSQSLAEKGFDVEIFAPSPPAGFEHMRPTGDKSIDSAGPRPALAPMRSFCLCPSAATAFTSTQARLH